MAVEASDEVFNKWLSKKLKSFDVEDDVMVSYISSLVTTEDLESEKKDMLTDILQNLVQGVDIDALCTEILNKWCECCRKIATTQQKEQTQFDLSERVSLILEKCVQPILKPANRSAEEEELRDAILSRCNFVSSEEEDDETEEPVAASSHSTPSQNQNVEAVAAAERERREKMKTESVMKKSQDKVNKEKQKQKQEERREKERKRTQKQERRR